MTPKYTKGGDLRQPVEKLSRKLADVQKTADGAAPTESPTFTTAVTGDPSMDVFNTGGTLNPASGTLRITIIKF